MQKNAFFYIHDFFGGLFMFHSFFGGVNPAPHKENTRRKPIAQLEQPPRRVYLPLTSGRDQALLPAVKPELNAHCRL